MSDTLPAVVEQKEKTPVAFGLIPKTIDEAWRVAQIFARSKIVPEAMREKPDDVFVAMQLGAELGLSPTNAVQTIAVINGRAGVFGDGFLGVIMKSPAYDRHDEWFEVDGERRDTLTDDDLKAPTTAAVCTFWRRGVEQPTTRRFSIADARRANLINKAGPWREYPARMLMFRARGFAGRDRFADVLKGMIPGEEAADLPAPPAPPPTVRRLSTPAAAAPELVDVPAAEAVVLDPSRLESLALVEGGDYVARLASGVEVRVDDADEAENLGPLVGAAIPIRMTVTREGEALRLLGWIEA